MITQAQTRLRSALITKLALEEDNTSKAKTLGIAAGTSAVGAGGAAASKYIPGRRALRLQHKFNLRQGKRTLGREYADTVRKLRSDRRYAGARSSQLSKMDKAIYSEGVTGAKTKFRQNTRGYARGANIGHRSNLEFLRGKVKSRAAIGAIAAPAAYLGGRYLYNKLRNTK